MRDRFGPFALALALLAWAVPGVAAPQPLRLTFLSLDGGGAKALGEAMSAGDMPALRQLVGEGVRAAQAQSAFPAKTAVGHATLWTGAPPAVHGVAGNRTDPRIWSANPWASVGGYDSEVLRATPIYAHLARHGLRVLAFNCSHSAPVSAYGPGGRLGHGLGDRLSIVDGFDLPFGPDGVWSASKGLTADDGAWLGPRPPSERPPVAWRSVWAGRQWAWLSVADPASTPSGYDTLWAQAEATASQAATLPFALPARPAASPGEVVSGAWSAPLAVAPGAFAHLRLFDMDPATGAPLLFRTAAARPRTNRPEWMASLRAAGGGFAPGMGGHSYHYGALGPTLAEGGTGVAESRYLESLSFANALQLAAIGHLVRQQQVDALFTYLPLPDQVEHQWTGYMQPGPAHQPELAKALRPHWRAAFRLADQAVASLRALNPQGTMAVASDHGMAGVAWDFRANVVLREAGLLRVDAKGQVDLARSLVSMPPHLGPVLRVHLAARHPGSPVATADRRAILDRAKVALMAVRVKGPQGGVPLLSRWVDADGAEGRELGLAAGVDAAFDLQSGYGVDGGVQGGARFVARPPNAVGNHLHDPRREDMQAVFIAAGPSLRQAWVAPPVRLEDVAPSLAYWLGLPPLPQARGQAQRLWLRPGRP